MCSDTTGSVPGEPDRRGRQVTAASSRTSLYPLEHAESQVSRADRSSVRSQSPSPSGGSPTILQVNLEKQHRPIDSIPDPSLSGEDSLDSERAAKNIAVLQPADEGFGAWSYAASAFAMFIAVWGFPESFPVFQAYLSSRQEHRTSIILPLLSPGINDILEGILFPLLPKGPQFRGPLVISGIGIIVLALMAASCSTHDWQFVLTQGVLFGVGGIVLNFVHVSIFSEWFDKKKGTAMGMIWLGWRVGSLGFPLICQWLLDSQGYEATLQVLVTPMIALLLPSVVAFRGRYPAAQVQSSSVRPPASKLKALRTPNVLFYLFVALLFSMVINVPTMFIMAYGADLGLDTSHQAVAYSLRIIGAMVGIYVCGKYSDAGLYPTLMIASTLLSSLVYFFIWGFAKSKLGLYAYAMAIGVTSGGYDNSLYGVFSEVAGNDNELFTTIHSMFSFFRGVAVLSIGPVGVALLRHSPEVVIDDYAIGKYKYLVVYVGCMSMASGVIMLGRLLVFNRSRRSH